MTFVKTPGEDPTQAASEAALEGLGSAVAKAAGEKVDKIVSAGQKALELAAGLKAAVTGGVAGAAAHEAGIIAEKLSIAGNLGVGLGGEIPGSAGGVISEGVGGNITGIAGAGELPFFEEKAITSFTGGKGQSPFDGGGGGMIGDAAGTLQGKLGGKNLELEVASGDALHVRNFSIQERLSSLFQVDLVVVSENHSIDFDAIVGQPAHFTLHGPMHDRRWSGLCNHFEQVRVETTGVSTYRLSIVPTLWLLTQRKNYRMFQQLTEPDIVLELLKEWSIETDIRIDRGAYKKRKYRVQYAESDFAFASRVLEDAGITFYFEQAGDETKLVLSDAPQANPKRDVPLLFLDNTSTVKSAEVEHATGVRMAQRVRPGKYTMRDHDYRQPPSYKLMSSASGGRGVEEKLERFHYTPGAFLFGSTQGDSSPVADDKGKTRTDEKEAGILAQKRLDAKRGSARVCTFETNALDLAPGVVLTMAGHPHAALGDGQKLLVVESSLSGTSKGEWTHHCEARGTEVPYRPDAVTPRPTVNGVESATVVGPGSEEIHCDEFGRVRVHFHWDRESKMNEDSSCWIHVSQAWGGSGYGGMNLPRVGQEVLVDFLGGDPDRPVIVGRMYTNLQKVPYKLPGNKTQSGLKSNSTGGGGGFNEIMFEDAGGQELLRMQAEKDLHKVVKNDEQHTVGRNRTRRVKGNEEVTVGKNRTKRIKEVETETIGIVKVTTVGVNRTSRVGAIDQTTVGAMHLVTVAPPHGGDATSATMMHQNIVFSTGAGATITMSGATISIKAKSIQIEATQGDVLIKGGPMVKINP